MRLKIAKTDDRGRSVPAGTEGTIVDINGVAGYCVEVPVLDEQGRQTDMHLIDIYHEDVESVT